MRLRRPADFLEETPFLLWLLFVLALVHAVRTLGIEWPYLEKGSFWALSGEPALSTWAALVSLAAIALLLPEGERLWRRRLVAAGLLILASVLTYRHMSAVVSLWSLQVLHVLLTPLVQRRRRKHEASASAGPLRSGPSATHPLTLAVVLAGVLLAAGATRMVARANPGLLLPWISPADRIEHAHRPVAAAVVVLGAARESSPALAPHPTLTREQVLEGVRAQGGGWSAGRALERLDRRKLLGALPPMEPARLAALLGPALASDVLRTRDETPAAAQGLWGVVVEAEHWKGSRRALLSLGLGEPAGRPATRYELLLEWPASGGEPQVLQATRFVARPSGFEGVAWPGVFLPLLLVCLLLTLGLAAAWTSRRRDGAARSSSAPG